MLRVTVQNKVKSVCGSDKLWTDKEKQRRAGGLRNSVTAEEWKAESCMTWSLSRFLPEYSENGLRCQMCDWINKLIIDRTFKIIDGLLKLGNGPFSELSASLSLQRQIKHSPLWKALKHIELNVFILRLSLSGQFNVLVN